MSICDWWNKRKYDKALKRGKDALDKSIYRQSESFADTVRIYQKPLTSVEISEAYRKAMAESFKPAPPETVESVLNKFIALGYDKPEVVIKGFTTQNGGGEFTATIDGEPVRCRVFGRTCELYGTLESAEAEVLAELKRKLGKLPLETIEVTY